MPIRSPVSSRSARRPGGRVGAGVTAGVKAGVTAGVTARVTATATATVTLAVAALTGLGVVPATATPLSATTRPAAVRVPGTLVVGARLNRGGVLALGTTRLVMQPDGNLVLSSGPGIVLWTSRTSRTPGAWASVKANGQLVVRMPSNRIVYASPVRLGTAPRVVVGEGEMSVRTSGRTAWTTGTGVRGYAISRLPAYGWNAAQWPCLDRLWQRESGWNPRAANPFSSAYGIPQALPGSKMATAGPDWRTNHRTQIAWGLGYIDQRYGSPCGAWSHSQGYGWYGSPGRTALLG